MPRKPKSSKPSDVGALMTRAFDGDESVLPALRDMFNREPRLWEITGNLAQQAERSMVKWVVGDNAFLQESLKWKLSDLRQELTGPEATPLERMLAERVAICWLQAYHADDKLAHDIREGGMSFEAIEFYQRWQDRSHRRLLQAIKSLAQVRRLLAPTVQVNIAKQQVNVAQ